MKCGEYSEEVPPVPIPNTVVKLLSADDTWGVTPWEIRTSQVFFIAPERSGVFHFFAIYTGYIYRHIIGRNIQNVDQETGAWKLVHFLHEKNINKL